MAGVIRTLKSKTTLLKQVLPKAIYYDLEKESDYLQFLVSKLY